MNTTMLEVIRIMYQRQLRYYRPLVLILNIKTLLRTVYETAGQVKNIHWIIKLDRRKYFWRQ